MARAVLELVGDPASMERAFGRVRRASQGVSQGVVRDARTVSAAQEREATRAAAAQIRELERAKKAADKTAAERVRNEREATRISEREAKARGLSAEKEAKTKQKALESLTAATEREERKRTRIERQAGAERAQQARRAGVAVAQVGRAAMQFGGAAHSQIQDARQRAAGRETSLNDALIQTGAGAEETAAMRRQIMTRIRAARLNPETVISALGDAQSFANALGGDDAAARQRSIDSTMSDVQFASTIDPNHMNGLVRLGALARRQFSNEGDRRSLLRASAGISFEGSVETDDMISRGLPGLQEAWAQGTANVRDPAQADRIRGEIARDFMSQVQSAAQSGRTVTVSANRTNSIRNALSLEDRQNRLGAAFASHRRTMTPEQQAAFDSTFTRDRGGRYRMAENISGNASEAARFMGTMFNNDPTKMRNFMGTHGAGGARQLINAPDVGHLAAFFGMTTNSRGQQVRMYDYQDELSRSTITPEREAEITRIRESEDQKALNADENARDAALADNTGALRNVSDRLASFGARNPLTQTALGSGGNLVGSLAGGVAATRLGGVVAPRLAALGLAAAGAGAGTTAGVAGAGLAAGLGIGEIGNRIAYSDADRAQSTTGGDTSIFSGETWRGAGQGFVDLFTGGIGGGGRNVGNGPPPPPTAQEIGTAVAAALHASPIAATVNPVDAEHATTQAISNRQAPR